MEAILRLKYNGPKNLSVSQVEVSYSELAMI